MKRIAAIVIVTGLAAAFLFELGPHGYVQEGGEALLAQLGAAGVSLGVLPNSYNTLAQQLEQKQQQLDTREQELQRREQEMQTSLPTGRSALWFYGLAAFAALLFILIVINFYLDHHREHPQQQS